MYASHNAAEDTELQLQAKFVCGEANTESYSSIEKKTIAPDEWVEFSGTVSVPGGCHTVHVIVNQDGGDEPFPDIYVDDAWALDDEVENLAGNDGAEYGTQGWQEFGGTMEQSEDFAHLGAYSMKTSGRSATWNGPSFLLPTGAGTYSVSAWVLHTGEDDAPVQLSAKILCGSEDDGDADYPFITSSTFAPGIWTELSGTLNVPEDCISVQLIANQHEVEDFPDIYMDDVEVARAP